MSNTSDITYESTNQGGGLYLVMRGDDYLGGVRKVGRKWYYRPTYRGECDTPYATRTAATEAMVERKRQGGREVTITAPTDAPADTRSDAQRYVDSRTPRRYSGVC